MHQASRRLGMLLASPALALASVRGVPKAEWAVYTAETFECKDGSAKLPVSQVNDDYCDCADGSDEPLTSACSGLAASLAPRAVPIPGEEGYHQGADLLKLLKPAAPKTPRPFVCGRVEAWRSSGDVMTQANAEMRRRRAPKRIVQGRIKVTNMIVVGVGS